MPIDTILQKIQSDSQKEIEEANKKTDEEVSDLLSKSSKEIAEIQKKINEKIKNEQDKYLYNIKSALDTKMKNDILDKKQTLLSDFYEKALEKFKEIPRENYEKFIRSLIDGLPKEKGEIIAIEKDKNLISKIVKEKKLPYDLSSRHIKKNGGFIFNTKNLEIDDTIETLISQLRDDVVIDISKILFEI